jgi:hypothetical protein
MTELIGAIPRGVLVEKDGKLSGALQKFVSDSTQLHLANTQSGPSSQRPTAQLTSKRYVGMPYFDTTLGFAIHLKSTDPDVWVNGAGTPV